MPATEDSAASEPVATVAPVRPSPYQQEWFFRLILFVCNFFIAIFLLVAIGCLLFVAFAAMTAKDKMEFAGVFSLFNAFLYSILGASAFGFFSYTLRMLSDIEQHTFRAAQCLTTIVESQSKRKAK